MEVWFLVIMGIMAVFIVLLLAKIYMLRKAAEEIETAFRDRLADDTNTLIDISGHDRQMRKLADSINVQLRELRGQRHRFLQGDQELKEAVTNISHDLRTPLTAVWGYLDLLEREENSPAAERYIGIIRNRTEIMKSLTDELFSYSVLLSGESGGKKEVIVNHVLEESIAAYYAAFKERGIEPDVELSEKKVIRIVDRSALSRVFANLINNALKYSDGDFYIRLSESGEIVFSNTASNLDEVSVGKLFDRFYTVSSARNSTGLGLAIARMLVRQMDGEISAYYSGKKLFVKVCL